MTTRRKSGALSRLVKRLQSYFSPKSIFTTEDRQFRLNWWEILCMIALGLLGCLVLDHVGRFDLSRPVIAVCGTLFITIRLRWRLRKYPWFWATIMIYTLLAACLTAALTWSTEGPSRGIIGGIMGIGVYSIFVVFHALELRSQS